MMKYPPRSVYDVSRKVFLMLYSINWPNFIAWLPLHIETLNTMCIAIIRCPACDVINFDIDNSLFIKSFFYIITKSGQICKIYQKGKELLT